jgi:hypothetical protein
MSLTARPNQALPAKIRRGAKNAQADGMSPAKKKRGKLPAKFMAGGGFRFLLVTFQYFVGRGVIKLVFSMNLFRLVYFESYQCGSLAPSLGGIAMLNVSINQ